MMERWRQIESVFQEALQRDPAERDAYVREACHGDSELHREVACLLANHREATDFKPWAAAAVAELIVDRASLQPGQCLGPYRIEAFLAAGGMGEVYRATDTRLHRDVAIKVSAARFSERFEREARVIASLNHPNICTLYDVGPNYLVMEYVEGPTLAERIQQGPIPMAGVLDITRQMTAALEAAHQRLIVHRDFKPGNVKIKPDGTVKVLDFGLAKLPATQSGPGANVTDSPTLTIAATRAGVLLGTAPYMSPEQTRGEPVDKRGDVWAFGVVLWEMLTGKRLFQGKATSDVLAAVIRDEPDLRQVPAKVRPLLKRCLEKDPQKRLRDIGDAMGIIESTPESRPASSRLVWMLTAVAAVFALAFAALSLVHFRETPPRAELMRFQIPGPQNNTFFASPLVSPNGRMIAFSARGPAGRNVLWVRSLDAVDARALPGTEDAVDTLFWSPDSRFLGFLAQGKLKKVAASGGPPQTLCDIPGILSSGAWSQNGVVIFGSQGHGLMRVSESGGTPSPLTVLDPSREGLHSAGAFLPDGRHFIYTRVSGAEYSGLYLGSLDASAERQSSRRLTATVSRATYAPSRDPDVGYVLFVRDGSLVAQAFDNRRMDLAGEAVPIADGFDDSVIAKFSVSGNGVLAYRTGSTVPITQPRWFDRAGKMLGAIAEAGEYNSLALSPDGIRAAVTHRSGRSQDIWVYEFAHGASQRVTFEPTMHFMPVWSPDSSRVVFASNPTGIFDLYQKASSGVGNENLLLKSSETKFPYDWSTDGRWLLYGVLAGQFNVWLLPLEGGDRKPTRYLTSQFNQSQARFSPDGRYISYTSDETGRNEVYVQPFPQPSGGKWPVSRGGGNQPLWRRDGKELFYISADSKMMAVDVSTTPVFSNGNPRALFATLVWGGGTSRNVTRYGVTPDGQKFLINTLTADAAAPASPITVVLNWQMGIKK